MKTRLIGSAGLCLLSLLYVTGCSDDDNRPACPTCPETKSPAPAALACVDNQREDLGLRFPMDEIRAYQVQVDFLGYTHVKCYQYYRSVRVYGGGLIVHLDDDLECYHMSGSLIRNVCVYVRPALTSQDALSIASDDFANKGYRGELDEPVELVVYRWLDIDHLCWRFVLQATNGFQVIEYFIDARNGEIVRWRSLIINN